MLQLWDSDLGIVPPGVLSLGTAVLVGVLPGAVLLGVVVPGVDPLGAVLLWPVLL